MRKALFAATIAAASSMAIAAPAAAQYYPQVRDTNRGETVIQVNRDCRVIYDRRGQRVDRTRYCDRGDLRQASRIMQRHARTADRYDSRDRYGEYDQRDRYRTSDRRDRYDSYDRRDRYDHRDRYSDRRGSRYIAPASVVGKRDDKAFDMLSYGGYRMVNRHPQRKNKMETVWWNRGANSCVSVYSRKGKVRAVMGAARQRCVVRY